MADEVEKDEPQDVTAYLGVDPIYMNHSDDRNKPFRAEAGEDEDGNDNEDVLDAEDFAYAHQSSVREAAGQDPDTGEAVELDPSEAYDNVRNQYKDENWRPNVPSAMTGKDQSAPEAPAPAPAPEAPAPSSPPYTPPNE